MKAWFVWSDNGYEWGDYVHGNTRNEAKAEFWQQWNHACGVEEWTQLRPRRASAFDNIPITRESILKIDGYENWYPICRCEICKV